MREKANVNDYQSQINKLSDLLFDRDVSLIGGGPVDAEILSAARYPVAVNSHWERQGYQPCAIFLTDTDRQLIHPQTRFVFIMATQGIHEHGDPRACLLPADTYRRTNPHGAEYEWINCFNKELGTKPLTGILAARLLLSLPIRSLTLTGFSFYSCDNVIPYQVGSHKIAPQIHWLQSQRDIDARLHCDGILTQILDRFERFDLTGPAQVIRDQDILWANGPHESIFSFNRSR